MTFYLLLPGSASVAVQECVFSTFILIGSAELTLLSARELDSFLARMPSAEELAEFQMQSLQLAMSKLERIQMTF